MNSADKKLDFDSLCTALANRRGLLWQSRSLLKLDACEGAR